MSSNCDINNTETVVATKSKFPAWGIALVVVGVAAVIAGTTFGIVYGLRAANKGKNQVENQLLAPSNQVSPGPGSTSSVPSAGMPVKPIGKPIGYSGSTGSTASGKPIPVPAAVPEKPERPEPSAKTAEKVDPAKAAPTKSAPTKAAPVENEDAIPSSAVRVENFDELSWKAAVGLANLGNTCWFNATVQSFLSLPPIAKSLIKYKGNDPKIRGLQSIMRKQWGKMGRTEGASSARKYYRTENFISEESLTSDKDAIIRGFHFRLNIQHDAAELSALLYGHMDGPRGKSSIVNFLRGSYGQTELFNTQTRVKSKGPAPSDSIILEAIPIGGSNLIDLLRSSTFADFGVLRDLNMNRNETSDDCKQKPSGELILNAAGTMCQVEENKSYKFRANGAPRVMQISLKRFNNVHNVLSKNEKSISFPDYLSMSEFIENSSGVAHSRKNYRLFAVVHHSGSFEGGHYYADAKIGLNGQWLRFDDGRVTPCTMPRSGSTPYQLYYVRNDQIHAGENFWNQFRG